ncbi:Putative cation diffusion facilitator family transporter, homolog to the magnetosome protein MamB (homolog to MamM) [Desulfamplus magnetovallimortis]|uniref:Magnetosome protein n=2 Tax=Desulfamplus magnetovallimortis TaxID=1246637 RepID=G8IQT6_9BACT|nr:cation diffusion facilitator family transporter [Desulfamplus magnetovallimortis]AET24909.1 magnetosome protein [Desulfamplus magnetovallimortis BW-1]CCO06708.1 Putative cation diffusion facilitator family transporter, homolog to the magnetosome protein MamB (homolog to MamM) [Desulfamplus magnetovallimortis BW-1]SLM32759.1 Putative cation diffusion facilitator family transporter, homolog to the magnetosome protein MamB (homolog to MamM) [Desulfamplus magnetovallimortis]
MEPDPITDPWIDESPENGLQGNHKSIRPVKKNIQQIYWTAFWANLGLACFKITIGMLGYSRLLIIDGLNSAANAIVITLILFGIHMSQPHSVSEKYPNGMGKAQYIFTLVIGFLIAAGAAGILEIAIRSFFSPISMEPVDVGIAVALISIIGNILIRHHLKASGSFYEKNELHTIARLQSLNIASSLVVGNALLISGLTGWYVAEHLGSISISLIVLWLSIRIIKQSLDGVMDRSCGGEIESRLTEIAASVEEVMEVKYLRTRRAGQVMMVDLQLCLNGDISVRQADAIVFQVEGKLSKELMDLSHVITIDRRPV